MAKHSSIDNALQELQNVLAKFPDGASIVAIQSQFGQPISLRTLQRRLATLQEQGIVTTSGQTRSTTYHLVHRVDKTPTEPSAEPSTGEIVPLSAYGRGVQRLIQQPVASRPPVGYNLDFLRSYRPNSDFYLSETERAKLLKLGQTAQPGQPAGTYARQILQRLLIDLSWNSSRLEGNTYSLLDTQRLLSEGQAADNKSAAEAQMILNHKDAIEFLVDSGGEVGFNRYTIMNLHALLSN